jgi:hypothetical protein
MYANVRVGAGEAELVRAALLELYAACATSIAEGAGKVAGRELQELREAFGAAERMLDAFGWEAGSTSPELELYGEEEAIGQVLRLAVSDAVDALNDSLERYHRGAVELEHVLRSLENLRALIRRFASFEREHAL